MRRTPDVVERYHRRDGKQVIVIRDPRGHEFEYVADRPGRPPTYDPSIPRDAKAPTPETREGEGTPSLSVISGEEVAKGMKALYVPVGDFDSLDNALKNTKIVDVERVYKRVARVNDGGESYSIPKDQLVPVQLGG